MYRRRGTDEDSSELVSEDAQGSEDEIEGDYTTRIREEKHNVPRPLSMLKLRLAAKTNSPKSKLVAWWITVGLLGLVALILVLVPLLVDRGKQKGCSDFIQNQYGPVREQPELPFFFQRDSGNFEVCHRGLSVLSGTLGVERPLSSEVKVNTFNDINGSTLSITKVPGHEEHCIRIAWVGTSSKAHPLQDCYHIRSDSYWYGAYEQQNQDWPLSFNDSEPFVNIPFVPTDLTGQGNGRFGSVLHPLWLSSDGVGISVDKGVPLHLTMNTKMMCLSAQPPQLDCGSEVSVRTFLNYTICALDTIANVAKFFLNSSSLVITPATLPDEFLFQAPLWTSSFQSGTTQISEEMIQVCEHIYSSNLSFSQIELGEAISLSFQNSLMTAINGTDELLKSPCSRTNTSLWVHPYVSYNWSDFEVGLQNNFFLPGHSNGETTISLVKWSGDFGAVTNFFSPSAQSSFEVKLDVIKSMSQVTSFNFQGGQFNYLPKCSFIDGILNSESFTETYVNFISSQNYSKLSSVRVGFYTQDKPVFVRLNRQVMGSSSRNLSFLLNTVLSVGLGGYFFVIPEVSAEFLSCRTENSNCYKLYIRWIQLNAFLPVMHLYPIPDLFNNSILIQHIKSLTDLHKSFNFARYANDATITGYPIIRPLWWKGSDRITWNISDQFYIGDDFMVAPMLDFSVNGRMVYFPKGSNYVKSSMSNLLTNSTSCPHGICEGGTHVYFPIKLYEILFFEIS